MIVIVVPSENCRQHHRRGCYMKGECRQNRYAEHYDNKNPAVALSGQLANCRSHQLCQASLMKCATDDEYAHDDNGRFAGKARQRFGRAQHPGDRQSNDDQHSDNIVSQPFRNQQSECCEKDNEETDLLNVYLHAASLP